MENLRVMIARPRLQGKPGARAIYDVQYADTVRDPIATVQGIYRHLATAVAAAEAAMQAYMANNQQGKHGKHSYDLPSTG